MSKRNKHRFKPYKGKSLRGLIRSAQRKGLTAIRYITKVGVVIECRNHCLFVVKGRSCPGCYAIEWNEIRGHPPTTFRFDREVAEWFVDQLLKLPASEQRRFDRNFSMGDYYPECHDELMYVNRLLKSAGRKLLLTTRQIQNMPAEYIELFDAVHVTVCTRNTTPSEMKAAYAARRRFKNVLISATVYTSADMEFFRNRVDIVRFYHGKKHAEICAENWPKKRREKFTAGMDVIVCGSVKGGCKNCPYDCIGGAVKNRKRTLSPPTIKKSGRWSARRKTRTGSGSQRRRKDG